MCIRDSTVHLSEMAINPHDMICNLYKVVFSGCLKCSELALVCLICFCGCAVLCVFWLQLDARLKPKVWLSRDDTSGRPLGDGIVGYDSPQAADLAIKRFNSKFAFNCVFESKR